MHIMCMHTLSVYTYICQYGYERQIDFISHLALLSPVPLYISPYFRTLQNSHYIHFMTFQDMCLHADTVHHISVHLVTHSSICTYIYIYVCIELLVPTNNAYNVYAYTVCLYMYLPIWIRETDRLYLAPCPTVSSASLPKLYTPKPMSHKKFRQCRDSLDTYTLDKAAKPKRQRDTHTHTNKNNNKNRVKKHKSTASPPCALFGSSHSCLDPLWVVVAFRGQGIAFVLRRLGLTDSPYRALKPKPWVTPTHLVTP